MRWSRTTHCVWIGLAVVLAGCGDSTTGPTDAAPPCMEPLTVIVQNGPTPTFTWTPVCGANQLDVEEVGGTPGSTSSMWAIGSEGALFAPAVQYGTLPPNATNLVPMVALQTGHRYRVTVMRTGGEVAILSQGWAEFTR